MKKLALAAALTTATFAGAAYAADAVDVDVAGATFTPESITFPEVMIDQPGYVVVYGVENGQPVADVPLGNMLVEAGDNLNVTVPIAGGVQNDTDYVAMLHYETSDNALFDHEVGSELKDEPVITAEGAPFMKAFKTQM